MAVYTPLTESDILDHLTYYDIGELISFAGIAEGIENSNFLLTTSRGKYILTLFEKRVRHEDLPFFMDAMEWMSQRGIACPKPLHMKSGDTIGWLKNKPATIVSFLKGKGNVAITTAHMRLLGETVAQWHVAAAEFPRLRTNDLSLPGWLQIAGKIRPRVDEIMPNLGALIDDELDFLSGSWPQHLPSGMVHADLFPDNVFFTESPLRLSGIIDFYFACTEIYAYDLAICINAWCFDEITHHFSDARYDALLEAYQKVRPLTQDEQRAMNVLCRGAALRFLLTRAHDMLFHPEGALVTPKNPKEYVQKLNFFRNA